MVEVHQAAFLGQDPLPKDNGTQSWEKLKNDSLKSHLCPISVEFCCEIVCASASFRTRLILRLSYFCVQTKFIVRSSVCTFERDSWFHRAYTVLASPEY